jgi:flagellar hook-associated protein 3 FlgL
MKPLPAIFAACCPEGRWLVVAPSGWPGVQTFDRTELRAVDSGGGAITYQGNNESIFQRLDRSTVLKTNVSGQELFLDSPPMFSVLEDLKTAIQNNDVTTIHARLDDLNLISDRINNTDTTVGGSLQLLDQIQSRLKSQNLALQTQSSSLTDANLVESISKFDLATQAVNVTLNSQAKVQQLSLIDFLR